MVEQHIAVDAGCMLADDFRRIMLKCMLVCLLADEAAKVRIDDQCAKGRVPVVGTARRKPLDPWVMQARNTAVGEATLGTLSTAAS